MSESGAATASISEDYRHKLVRMAGDIARFFRAYPEDAAIAAIADHINQFWSRRMRDDLVSLAADDAALEPLVRKALPKLRTSIA